MKSGAGVRHYIWECQRRNVPDRDEKQFYYSRVNNPPLDRASSRSSHKSTGFCDKHLSIRSALVDRSSRDRNDDGKSVAGILPMTFSREESMTEDGLIAVVVKWT